MGSRAGVILSMVGFSKGHTLTPAGLNYTIAVPTKGRKHGTPDVEALNGNTKDTLRWARVFCFGDLALVFLCLVIAPSVKYRVPLCSNDSLCSKVLTLCSEEFLCVHRSPSHL